MTRAIVSLAVLLAVFEIGSCIRCFQCNSQSDSQCMDPYAQHYGGGRQLVDCNVDNGYNRQFLRNILPPPFVDGTAGAPKYCAKIITETGTTIRTCLDANPLDPNQTCRAIERSITEYSPNRQLRHCSICERDDCNGSSTVAFSFPLTFLALITSYLFYKQ